jgi:hypothetical protein
MVEDFRALAEATTPDGLPRYPERPLLEDVARFLVRGGSGPNPDAAFYELCHLVNAIDASENARDRRNAFFLGPERASAARFHARLDHALSKNGWRRPGFSRTDEGVVMRYADVDFTVRFGRMPFLAALYEFLAGMDEFAFYAELQTIFDGMTSRLPDLKAIQAASNRIASHFRQYRRRHLARTQQEGKFDLILGFLAERSPPDRLVIDDAGVFDFWAKTSSSGDFRAYRTVFDAFVNFLRAVDAAGRAEAMVRALPIGVDRQKGEVEPDDSNGHLDGWSEWVSPLSLLDEGPAAGIKFFKGEGERKPIELLMRYGPMAARLPLAFLRLESFGPVQSAITNDLQIGRGRDRVESRALCGDAEPYQNIIERFERITEIVARLQKAAFYVLHKASQGAQNDATDKATVVAKTAPDVAALFNQARAGSEDGPELPASEAIERMVAEAAKTFHSIARKGFDEAGLADEARVEGFRLGAGALIAIGAQLDNYLAAATRIERMEQRSGRLSLDEWFEADRNAFRERFCALYGVTP